jgi:hypothetical protein
MNKEPMRLGRRRMQRLLNESFLEGPVEFDKTVDGSTLPFEELPFYQRGACFTALAARLEALGLDLSADLSHVQHASRPSKVRGPKWAFKAAAAGVTRSELNGYSSGDEAWVVVAREFSANSSALPAAASLPAPLFAPPALAVPPPALTPAPPPPVDAEDSVTLDRIARAATHLYLRPPAPSSGCEPRAASRPEQHAMLRRLSPEHRAALDECRADQARMAILHAAEADVRSYLRLAVAAAEARTDALGNGHDDVPPRRRRGQRRPRRSGTTDADDARELYTSGLQGPRPPLLLRLSLEALQAPVPALASRGALSVTADGEANPGGACGPPPGIAGLPTPTALDAAVSSSVPPAAARATLQAVCSFYCLRSWRLQEDTTHQGSLSIVGDTAGGAIGLTVAACLPTPREGLDAATLAQRWLGIKAASQISLGRVLQRDS